MPTEATPLELEVRARREAIREAAQAREDRLEAAYQALCAAQERELRDTLEMLFAPEHLARLCLKSTRIAGDDH